MQQISEHLYLVERPHSSNVYLIVCGKDLILIDSGLLGETRLIISEIEGAGFHLADLKMILLTHGHVDHAGNTAELINRFGARVLAHRDEVLYLEKTRPMPTRTLFQKGIGRLFPGGSPVKVDKELEDDDVIEVFGGLQVIHTPGHTPGSICFYQPKKGILFYGDSLSQKKSRSGIGVLGEPKPHFTIDLEAARLSAQKLLALPASIYCPGHGRPLVKMEGGDLREM